MSPGRRGRRKGGKGRKGPTDNPEAGPKVDQAETPWQPTEEFLASPEPAIPWELSDVLLVNPPPMTPWESPDWIPGPARPGDDKIEGKGPFDEPTAGE